MREAHSRGKALCSWPWELTPGLYIIYSNDTEPGHLIIFYFLQIPFDVFLNQELLCAECGKLPYLLSFDHHDFTDTPDVLQRKDREGCCTKV